MNSLVYRTLFYVNIYGSFKISKNRPVFLAHPVYINISIRNDVFVIVLVILRGHRHGWSYLEKSWNLMVLESAHPEHCALQWFVEVTIFVSIWILTICVCSDSTPRRHLPGMQASACCRSVDRSWRCNSWQWLSLVSSRLSQRFSTFSLYKLMMMLMLKLIVIPITAGVVCMHQCEYLAFGAANVIILHQSRAEWKEGRKRRDWR